MNSKLWKNRAGKLRLYRGRTVFWNHCKTSLEAVFSNVVSAGDGLQKWKGINNGFVISLPPSPWWVPTSSQSLWDLTEALRQELHRSLFQPAKRPLCSFFSSAPSLLKKSASSGKLETWHTHTELGHPTTSPLLPSCTAKQNDSQQLPTVVACAKRMSHSLFFVGKSSQICL